MTTEPIAGQTALVTGAGRGIGRAVASHLASRGATVVIASRTTAELDDLADAVETEPGSAHPLTLDVTDSAAIRAAADEVHSRFGRIDLAVHAAGTAEVIGPLWESDLEAWWAEVAVHAKGAAALAHAVLPGMIARGSGRIVNIYGNLGDRGGGYASAYACGKAGLLRLTENLNAESQPHGVRIFALHPGLVATRMTRRLGSDDAARRWLPRFSEIPADRWHPPENAAEMIEAIGVGSLDAFAGRLIGAWEDVGSLVAPDGDERTLRVVPSASR